MILVLLLLLLSAGDRLLASGRIARLDPAAQAWRLRKPRAVAYLRSAPGTYTYLFILLITTWVLQTSSNTIAQQLLLERSTNLHQLARDPIRVLVASAFWVGGVGELLLWLVLFSAVVAPVEHWLGTTRTAVVFFAGHIGATLLTALGLWLSVRVDLVSSSVANATDVGASYGFAAVAAVLAGLLRRRACRVYVAVLVVYVAGILAIDHTFTNWGHLVALAIGFALAPLVRRRAVSPGRS